MTPEEIRKAKDREKAARYRARHPDRVKASKAKYRAKPEAKEKEKADFKEWAKKNKDRLNAKRRDRYANDPEYRDRVRKQNSDSQKKNRERVNAYRRNRRSNDPVFKLQHSIGVQMRQAIKGKAKHTWKSIVGYSAGELKVHLERQFEPWMSWDNYGTEWHIDHRRPVATFDLPREAKLCWSLQNLRPLSISENVQRKDEIDPSVIPDELMPVPSWSVRK